jgi:hypothetical protein
MKLLRATALLTAALVFHSFNDATAQAQSAGPEVSSCRWNCFHILLPYGLYIREVTDGGSFVTLEDGSIWEVRLPQRPVASSWRAGDFVQIRNVWAPVQNFDFLLTHGDNDRAEVRLAGRARPPAQE